MNMDIHYIGLFYFVPMVVNLNSVLQIKDHSSIYKHCIVLLQLTSFNPTSFNHQTFPIAIFSVHRQTKSNSSLREGH